MSETYSVDIIYRIWDDSEGVFLELGPGEGGLGLELRTTTIQSQNYWGAIKVMLPTRELAAKLGATLIEASKTMKG